MKFKVEMKFLYGWGDAEWTDGDENPLRFASIQEAQAEIDSHIKDMLDAVNLGEIDSSPTANEFRIVEVEE